MPNYCDFQVKLTGPIEDIIKFYNACHNPYQGDSSDPIHFYRIFEFNISELNRHDQEYVCYAYGYCAWSVVSCMMPNGYHKDYPNTNGVTLYDFPTLKIEIFSTECGMCFSEHIIVNKGNLECDECEDYYELDEEVELEEFNKLTGLDWTQEQKDQYYKEEDYYVITDHNFEFEGD